MIDRTLDPRFRARFRMTVQLDIVELLAQRNSLRTGRPTIGILLVGATPCASWQSKPVDGSVRSRCSKPMGDAATAVDERTLPASERHCSLAPAGDRTPSGRSCLAASRPRADLRDDRSWLVHRLAHRRRRRQDARLCHRRQARGRPHARSDGERVRSEVAKTSGRLWTCSTLSGRSCSWLALIPCQQSSIKRRRRRRSSPSTHGLRSISPRRRSCRPAAGEAARIDCQPGVVAVDEALWPPSAAATGRLAVELSARGDSVAPLELVPHYFRKSAAEEKRWPAHGRWRKIKRTHAAIASAAAARSSHRCPPQCAPPTRTAPRYWLHGMYTPRSMRPQK